MYFAMNRQIGLGLVTGALALCMSFGLVACGEDTESESESQQACTTSSDCPEGHVCLAQGAYSGCAPICTGEVGECSGSASCGGVGLMTVSVCQEPAGTSEQDAPDPEEQPRIPCGSDQECAAIQPGTICAEWRNQRDCTIPCTVEAECDMPSVGGMSMDFMTCIPDEGQPGRNACLPDAACFDDVLSCVDMGGIGGF